MIVNITDFANRLALGFTTAKEFEAWRGETFETLKQADDTKLGVLLTHAKLAMKRIDKEAPDQSFEAALLVHDIGIQIRLRKREAKIRERDAARRLQKGA